MIKELTKQIEDSYYWDARVRILECNYFGDEVKLVFKDREKDIVYRFEECYKVSIEHLLDYLKTKSSKDLEYAQIPYFMQDVELTEILVDDEKYLKFKIDMYPIKLNIVCKKFSIS